MPKIKSTELEKMIAEEIENVLLNEGFFDQIGAGLKGAVKGFGQQRSADKESEQIIRIAAEILSDPMRTGIDYTGDMESSRTPTLASLLGSSDKQATSKMSFVREEESQEELEEATSKEISFFTKKIKQALANGQVTIDGLKSEIQRLSSNDVVRAIPGVMEMFPREKPADNAGVPVQQTPPEEEPTKVIPSQADLTQVDQTKVDGGSPEQQVSMKEKILNRLLSARTEESLETARDYYIAARESGKISLEDASEMFDAYLDGVKYLLNK